MPEGALGSKEIIWLIKTCKYFLNPQQVLSSPTSIKMTRLFATKGDKLYALATILSPKQSLTLVSYISYFTTQELSSLS